jgi:type VI secretion system lysozyme-like protein
VTRATTGRSQQNTGPRRARFSRPLLFERLVGPPRTAAQTEQAGAGAGPPRLHDVHDLRASIERELTDLLNTRAPLPIEALEGRARSAIDYGVPDLSAFPAGQSDAMDRLARHLRDAVAAYEPRLRDPMVQIERDGRSADALTVIVQGSIETGTMHDMKVTFRLLRDAVEPADDAA